MTSRARRIQPADMDEIVRMRRLLFPDCDDRQQRLELARYFEVPTPPAGAVGNQDCFVLERADGAGLTGFAEVMLRSHAEGCWDYTADGTLGVAYLEAWWVDPDARRQGAGRQLVQACERWARTQGSPALASDAKLDNQLSHRAHRGLGFQEVERSVHFVKKL